MAYFQECQPRTFILGNSKLSPQVHQGLRHNCTSLSTTKDTTWAWTDKCQQAFDRLKDALTSEPVLKQPDFSQHFEVSTDASGYGLGAALSQNGHPVAFESRKLTPAERIYTTTDQELLGVIHALKTW
jgi:hypothetical protein